MNVYIDGFNLYYRALKGTPCKWLDLAALCRALLPRDHLHRIRYFTARISGRPDDPGAPTRQDTYLRALATLPDVTVHLGQFIESVVRMRLANPPAAGPGTVEVIKTEEIDGDHPGPIPDRCVPGLDSDRLEAGHWEPLPGEYDFTADVIRVLRKEANRPTQLSGPVRRRRKGNLP